MKFNHFLRNLFFKFCYGFQGFPLQVSDQCLRMDESLRRWDVNSELAALKSLQQYLQPNDIFIDVGANFGLHTLYAAKLLEHQGQVFAFEPVISNLKLLQRNITLNSLNQRVTIVSKAVSNSRQKSISFYLPSKDMTVTASLNQTSDNSLEIEVENTRLDDYWQAVDLAIKLIKIDVEGAELEVLRGAENILKKWHPVLVIEVHGFALPEFGSSVNELRNFLSNLGYEEKRLEGEQFDGDEYFQAVYTVN